MHDGDRFAVRAVYLLIEQMGRVDMDSGCIIYINELSNTTTSSVEVCADKKKATKTKSVSQSAQSTCHRY